MALVIVISAAYLSGFHKARSRLAPCMINLQKIEAFKRRWTTDNRRSSNDTPTWQDFEYYFELYGLTNSGPVCPKGGVYTLGRVSESPKCSIGGMDHRLTERK